MKTLTSLVWVLLALFGVAAQAAYIDTASCNNSAGCGYYLPYEGRLAGFVNWELNSTPVLAMSIDPTIHAPTAPGTPVSLFTYSDVMASDSGFTPEEQVKLSQIAALVDLAVNSGFFYLDYTTPPTGCIVGDSNCANLSAGLNSVAWNIWLPGSVPMVDWASETYTDLTSGNYAAYDGTLSMVLMTIEGGDTFVIPLAGANPESLMVHTPIPASAWLFGSGMLGLVAVSRRRTNWA